MVGHRRRRRQHRPGRSADRLPHSETTLSVIGNTGVALAVIAAALAAMEALPGLRRLCGPAIAVGTMSLSAYVLHIVAIHYLGVSDLPGPPAHVLVAFIATAMLLAVAWRRFFRRGPLESAFTGLTKVARYVP
ncbi:DUF418 domain-containing protein [Streptomyces sp. M19]